MKSIRPRPPSAPDWVDRMDGNRWYRISGTSPDLDLPATPSGTRYLIDNDPAGDPQLNPPRNVRERLRRLLGRAPLSPWHGSNGISAITECWNSAVLATRLGDSGSMVCFGGGHNDYFGSDVHRFDIATRQWTRILDGYLNGAPAEYGPGAVYPSSTYPDGSPLPPHTYNYLQYDPVGNDMLLFKGQMELGPDVQAIAIPHLLNLDTLEWRHGPEHPTGIFNSGGWTTWDPGRRRLWGHSGDDGGGNGLSWFSPDGGQEGVVGVWGPLYVNKLPGNANHNAMQLDPRRDVILVAVHAMNDLCLMDPSDPESPLVPIKQSESRPAVAEYSALEYSEALDCFVFFTPVRGTEVFYLTAPAATAGHGLSTGTWEWHSVLSLLNPIEDARDTSAFCHHPEQVFGRFRVIDYEVATVAVLVRHVDSPVYAMRLR